MKLVLPLVCLAAVVAVTSARGTSSLQLATETSFRDRTAEDPAGPDITTVTVRSEGNVLGFRVGLPTNPTVTPDLRLRIWLDADDDRTTGLDVEGLTGRDHFLLVDPTRFGPGEAALYSCSGSSCGPSSEPPDFVYSSGATFALDARTLGLGRVQRIRFLVEATDGIRYDPATGYDFSAAHFDTAPDEGDWTFDARPLRVASFGTTPARPRAGKGFILIARVLHVETGPKLAGGKVACSLEVAGKRVRARRSTLAEGRARCEFPIPAGAKGKRFRATISVTAGGAVVRRSVSGRVRG